MHNETSGGLGPEGILGLLGLTILLVSAVIWSARGPRTEKTDFAFTYMGAMIVHRGQAARLYDREFQVRTREALFADPNPLLYEHPPFEALLLSPLVTLRFRTAYLVWGLLNVVAWVLAMIVVRPYCRWPSQDLAYICLWPLFAPLGVSLFQGQTSLFVLAFIAAGFVLLERSSDFSAGLCFGLALCKPQVVLPLILILLLRKNWSAVAGAAVTGTLLGSLSVVAVGFRGLGQYATFLLEISRTPRDLSSGSAVDMGSIHGFLFALLSRIMNQRSISAISVLVSLLLLWLVAKGWSKLKKFTKLGFAAAIALSLVAGDHMFTHDFSPLVIALLLVGAYLFADGSILQQRQSLRVGLRSVFISLWCFPLYFVLVAYHCLFLLAPLLVLFAILVLIAASNTEDAVRNSAIAGAG